VARARNLSRAAAPRAAGLRGRSACAGSSTEYLGRGSPSGVQVARERPRSHSPVAALRPPARAPAVATPDDDPLPALPPPVDAAALHERAV